MYAESIGEFESVEEGVSDDGRSIIGSTGLEESADHFRSEDATELVAQLYGMAATIGRDARFHSHVELT